MMDTMCVKVQDHLNSLRFSETNSVQDDVKAAENLMKDARNSKTVRVLMSTQQTLYTLFYLKCFNFTRFQCVQLLPNLYHLKSSGSRGPCVGAIQDKLESVAGEVAQVMDQQLQV